jgi:hypothetical protein
MANFYAPIENLPKAAPNSLNPSGKKSDLVDNLIQRAIGSNGRVKDNMTFRGLILYSTPIPEKVFKQKFWPDIVNYVIPQSGAKRVVNANRVVIESIVYVQELCGCLPRPAASDAQKFFEALEAVKKNPKDSYESLVQKSEKLKDTKNAERYLKMIKRFPKVYSLLEGDFVGPPPAPGSGVVTVKFPYEYDTSIGVVVPPKSQ